MTTRSAPVPAGPAPARTRRLPTAVGIAGVLLFVIGQALFPALDRDPDLAFAQMLAARDQLIAARLCTVAGAFALLATVRPLGSLAPGRGRTVMVVGLTMYAAGTFLNGLSQAVNGYAAWATTAPGIDHAAAMPALLEIDAGVVGLPVAYWSIPLFGLGVLTVGVALLIAGSTPRWMPLLLLVGAVLAFATAGLGPIVALTQAPLAVALIALLRQADRAPTPGAPDAALVRTPPTLHAETDRRVRDARG